MGDDITITYLYRYTVERQVSIFFGLGKRWGKVLSYYNLEQAKAKIKILKEGEILKVIDVD